MKESAGNCRRYRPLSQMVSNGDRSPVSVIEEESDRSSALGAAAPSAIRSYGALRLDLQGKHEGTEALSMSINTQRPGHAVGRAPLQDEIEGAQIGHAIS